MGCLKQAAVGCAGVAALALVGAGYAAYSLYATVRDVRAFAQDTQIQYATIGNTVIGRAEVRNDGGQTNIIFRAYQAQKTAEACTQVAGQTNFGQYVKNKLSTPTTPRENRTISPSTHPHVWHIYARKCKVLQDEVTRNAAKMQYISGTQALEKILENVASQ